MMCGIINCYAGVLMYDGWSIARWDTPVADIVQLLKVSLVDANCELTAVFEDTRSPTRTRWRVRFRNYPAYRNIDEAYRTDLWQWLDRSGQRCGFTFIVRETPLLDSWGTVYLHEVLPNIQHYVIATDNDVLEVLSTESPIWETADDMPPGDAPPSKVRHLYVGQDDDEINQLIIETQAKNKPAPSG